ncbi:MAG TPA: MCP four helix bundle domain-containing protein, partial [Microvirga sp.]
MLMMKHVSIRTKLYIALATLGTLLVAVLLGGGMATSLMRGTITTIYADRVVPLRDLKVVADLYAVNIVDASHKVRNRNIAWEEGLKGVEAARAEIRQRWTAYMATAMDAQEGALAQRAETLMRQADSVVEQLTRILKAKDEAALAAFTMRDLYSAIDPVSEAVTKLVEIQLDVAKAEAERAEQVFEGLKIGFAAAAFCVLVALVLAGRTVSRDVTSPLTRLSRQMQQIAGGDLETVVTDSDRRNEVGSLAGSLQVFKDALIAKRAADEAAALEADAKMRRAARLDQVTKSFEANVQALTQGL